MFIKPREEPNARRRLGEGPDSVQPRLPLDASDRLYWSEYGRRGKSRFRLGKAQVVKGIRRRQCPHGGILGQVLEHAASDMTG